MAILRTLVELVKNYIKELTSDVKLTPNAKPETIFEGAIIELGNVLFYVVDIVDDVVVIALMSKCWQCGTREDVIIDYMPDLEERTFTTERAIVELDLVYELPIEILETFGKVVSAELNEQRFKNIKNAIIGDAEVPFSERGIGSAETGIRKQFKDVEAKRSWKLISEFIVP